eukprot:CAMPEP_0170748910 /NCGR_PEP_ID=MMETSP0437-20130122/10117_1 /TAXON_ID=0 /ORGANISM="Sexangularia sp." /LENGTH=171 /DNA_ID=CAMNT_0011087805 /DNA_START=50 /DNA_END=565 /DNA_ORIENTATION=+
MTDPVLVAADGRSDVVVRYAIAHTPSSTPIVIATGVRERAPSSFENPFEPGTHMRNHPGTTEKQTASFGGEKGGGVGAAMQRMMAAYEELCVREDRACSFTTFAVPYAASGEDIGDRLCGVASSVGARELLVGWRGLTPSQRLGHGSVSARAVSKCPCTVTVVKGPTTPHK